MTLTFSEHEWSDHVSAIEQFRYKRELAMVEAIKSHGGEQLAEDIMRKYRQILHAGTCHLPSPIPGTNLNVT